MESPLRRATDRTALRLIETAHWDGTDCRLLDRHLARMAAGADALGWAMPPNARETFTGPAGTPARLRILLDAEGMLSREASPPPAPITLWRVGVSAVSLRSDDPWLGIKSTHRPGYDAARAALPPGLDEVLLLNERGEVCDGSITTVFFDRGEGMRTPPLSAGLLPGVLRAEQIAQGAREETLLPGDLPNVRLWVGNALRGLCPAVYGAA